MGTHRQRRAQGNTVDDHRRRPLWVLLSLLILAVMVIVPAGPAPSPAGASPAQPGPTYTNPVLNGLAVNPSVLKAPDGFYYAYLNGFDFTGTPWPVPVFRSTDLASWTAVGNGLPTPGAWVDASSGLNVTSPSVHHLPTNPASSRYVLYFSARQASTGNRCIGVATASSPSGPFTGAANPLICPPGGAQDPSIVSLPASAGIHNLLYRRNGTGAGLYNQVLTGNGQAAASGWDPIPLLTAPPGWWQNGVVERPSYVPIGSGGALVFAGGAANTGARAIGWAPCTVNLAVVVGCSVPVDGGRLMATTNEVASPSGPQVFSDGTHLWLAYDGLPGGSCSGTTCSGIRTMRVDKLCAADGRPRTNAPSTGAQSLGRSTSCASDVPNGWVATWASSVGVPAANWEDWGYERAVAGFQAETLRQVVHTSIGGSAVRVRISNRFGTTPLRVGSATVAVSTDDDGNTAAVNGPVQPLTFGGQAGTTIPAGGAVTSDVVGLNVPADHDLAASLYLPDPTGPPNGHMDAGETSHIGPGNRVADTGGGNFTATTTGGYFLTAVDVLHAAPRGAVVVLGDSLSDGIFFVPDDSEQRWPDRVVDRLLAGGPLHIGVPNVAYAGAALLPASDPNSALGRFDRDVLAQAGVETVFVHLGTNDLGTRTASEIVAALQQIIDRSHAAGVRVVASTIPPVGGPVAEPPLCAGEGPPDPTAETRRLAVNARIRPGQPDSLGFDAVVDFDAVLRRPADPSRIQCQYAGFGNNFHPNVAGHLAEANAVNLATLIP